MSRPVDISGQRFGRLVAVRLTGAKTRQGRAWLCRCDCGGERDTTIAQLRVGEVHACATCQTRPTGEVWQRAHARHVSKLRARWLLIGDGVLPRPLRRWPV